MNGTDPDIGRGGHGANTSVSTLLGWTILVTRRLQYQLKGGKFEEHKKLTKKKWKAMFETECSSEN